MIRGARGTDEAAIAALLTYTFGGPGEARLVGNLRQAKQLLISLVAEVDDQLVGYIGFSPAQITGAKPTTGLALAPLAVAPTYQRRHIGSQLVHAGLVHANKLAVDWVVVLGDPSFYGRFGFRPASDFDLTHDYGTGPVQLLPLAPAEVEIQPGYIQYAPAFSDLDEHTV